MNIRKRILFSGLLILAMSAAANAAHVVSAQGEVERGRGEPAVWSDLSAGDPLEPGDRVRTGEDGRAELKLGRVDIRLYPDSVLRVPAETSLDDPAAVRLEEGVSLFDVRPAPTPFEVRTPEVVVSVKGTRFSVAIGAASASVAVYRGSVGVRSMALESAREVLVREGFAASGAKSFRLDWVDQADPWDAFGGTELPEVWQSEWDPAAPGGPANSAMESVHAAARAEAVTFAAERHPQVRERLERAHAARLQKKGASPQVADEAVRAEVRSEIMAAVQRDGVSEIRERIAAMNQEYMEAWMNGGVPGGGSTNPNGFDLNLVTGTDPYLEILDLASGQTWALDQDFFQAVLAGSQTLPSPLLALLDSQGISDPTLFAQQILLLFAN